MSTRILPLLAGSLLSAAAGLLVLHLALPKKAAPDAEY